MTLQRSQETAVEARPNPEGLHDCGAPHTDVENDMLHGSGAFSIGPNVVCCLLLAPSLQYMHRVRLHVTRECFVCATTAML